MAGPLSERAASREGAADLLLEREEEARPADEKERPERGQRRVVGRPQSAGGDREKPVLGDTGQD